MVRTLAPGTTVNLEVTVENAGGLDDTQDILLNARDGTTQTVDQVTGLTLTSGQTSNTLSLTWAIPQDQALDTYDLVVVTEDDELIVDTYIIREANSIPNSGIAQYQLDGDVTDTWGNNDGTNNGVSFIDDSVRGQVGDFNGSGDYVQLPFSADGSSTSISTWAKSDTFGTDSYETIIASYDGASGIALQMDTSDGTVRSIVFDGTGELSAVSSTSINDGAWYHIVGEYNGSDTVRIYVNGLLEDTSTSSIGNIDSSTNYSIGRQPNLNGEFWLGQIDKVEVYDTTLTANEVSRLYKEGSILSYEPFPASAISRWTFDDADTDGSTALDSWIGLDGTMIGGVTTGVAGASQTYDTGEAYDFNGTDGYIDVGDRSELDFNNGDFSFAFWANPDDVSSNGEVINKEQAGTNTVGYFVRNDNGDIQFQNSDSSTSSVTSVIGGFTQGEWIFVVGTVSNGNRIRLYTSGTLSSEDSHGGHDVSSSSVFTIGSRVGSDNFFDGVIDDLRAYTKELSGREVFNLYENGSIRETTGTIVDDFEAELYEEQSNTLDTYYTGDLGNFERQSSTVVGGANALRCIGGGGFYDITTDTELLTKPSQGDTIEVRMRFGGVSDEDNRFLFGYQDVNNYYAINLSPNNGAFELNERSGGNTSDLDTAAQTFTAGVWYTVTLDWGSGGLINVTLEDDTGQISSLAGTSTMYTSGEFGFQGTATGGLTNDLYWDTVRMI